MSMETNQHAFPADTVVAVLPDADGLCSVGPHDPRGDTHKCCQTRCGTNQPKLYDSHVLCL